MNETELWMLQITGWVFVMMWSWSIERRLTHIRKALEATEQALILLASYPKPPKPSQEQPNPPKPKEQP